MHGLRSAAGIALNGMIGTVAGTGADTGRLQVRLLDLPSRLKLIKEENLRPVDKDMKKSYEDDAKESVLLDETSLVFHTPDDTPRECRNRGDGSLPAPLATVPDGGDAR